MSTVPYTARRIPLLGSLPHLINQKLGFLEATRSEVGDIFRLDLGFTDVYVFAHPEHAQHILRNNAKQYDKGGKIYDLLRVVGGNGLATTNDQDFWLRQRRMMQPQFHHRRLSVLTDIMVDAIEDVLDDLEPLADCGAKFNLVDYIARMTINVIVRTMFGTSLSPAEATELGEHVEIVFDGLLTGSLATGAPSWLPVPGRKRFQTSLKIIEDKIYQVIQERRQQDRTMHNDLISMMIDLVDAETNEQMTDDQLRDEAITFFIAGYETTATALQWAFHFINEYPEAGHALYQEIDTVLGKRRPGFKDVGELDYTRRFLQETMRLRPPIYWIVRNSVEDDKIDGYTIPSGKIVVVMSYLIHRHPDVWEQPDVFDPDRFCPENVNGRHQLAWLPFGSGQRQCIGRDFAIMEGQLILASLLQRFKVIPEAAHTVKPYVSTSLRTNGVMVTLHHRG